MNNYTWKTGFPALDKMLGFERPAWQRASIIANTNGKPLKGQIVLLRGAPGTGKTTLGLQMLLNHVVSKDSSTGLFISLEADPKRVLDSMKAGNRLPKHLLAKSDRLITLGRDQCSNQISSADATTFERLFPEIIRNTLGTNDSDLIPPPLIVLDSLNLLGDLLRAHCAPANRSFDLRGPMFRLWTRILSIVDNATIILVGEYHPEESGSNLLAHESFTCDVEILLGIEPIAGTTTRSPAESSPLGYSIERRLSDHPQDEGVAQCVESRPFCRVLKSRYSPNQSRRCAYDIIEHQGIVFSETNTGDGSVLFFAENVKQQELWNDFISQDIPHHFPALRYSLFNRTGMQRTFADHRRHLEYAQKIDTSLVCFDAYWVNWYQQLCRRAAIKECLLQFLFDRTDASDHFNSPGKLSEHLSKFHKQTWSQVLALADKHLYSRPRVQPNNTDENQQERPILESFLGSLLASLTVIPIVLEKPLIKVLRRLRIEVNCWHSTIFHPLKTKSLRLYGERNAGFIYCLKSPRQPRLESNIRIIREKRIPKSDGDDYWLTIPYNANVSFLVVRSDILDERHKKTKSKQNYFDDLTILCKEQYDTLIRAGIDLSLISDLQDDNRIMRAAERLASGSLPMTWEEIILLSQPGDLLIETKSFDSFICVFLEIIWGLGGDLDINENYDIYEPDKTRRNVFLACYILSLLFKREIITRHSTLDAEAFPLDSDSATNCQAPATRKVHPKDALFARHWHSTLIDTLTTRKRPVTNKQGEYSWCPKCATPGKPTLPTLKITTLPYSLFAQVYLNACNVGPVSCWGEWHFAILRGTENETLATELINNLMSSQKIYDRAIAGAALPTVDKFYEGYGHIPCINLPDRDDINLPTTTFRELSERIFPIAHSRNAIFDFRHCLRLFHGLLTEIQLNPLCYDNPQILMLRIESIFESIKDLKNDLTMTH